jgi:predicted RNA binding protein YcfA (HicA-like mRNA interferase family)
MDIQRLIGQLAQSHSPVPVAKFERVAQHFGFVLDHVRGSHYIFRNWTGKKYVMPVHANKIKGFYIRNFIKEQQ